MMYEKYKDECFKDVCLDSIKSDIERRIGEELEIPKIKDIEITMNNGQEILYKITFTDNSVREIFDSSARLYEECTKEIIGNEGGKMTNEEEKEEFARLLMEEYDLRPSEACDYMNRFFRWLEEKGVTDMKAEYEAEKQGIKD